MRVKSGLGVGYQWLRCEVRAGPVWVESGEGSGMTLQVRGLGVREVCWSV